MPMESMLPSLFAGEAFRAAALPAELPSDTLMGSVMLLAFIGLLIGSGWGGYRLACYWTKGTFGRVFITTLLFVIFTVAGSIGLVAGCVAVTGGLNIR